MTAPPQLGNPLPADGLVGRLTANQYNSLKLFWKELFRLVDAAPDKGPDPDSEFYDQKDDVIIATSDPASINNKDSEIEFDSKLDPTVSNPPLTPPSVVKDEHLKEKLRSEQELRDAKAALEKYGKTRFMDAFWNMMMMDDPDVIVLKFLRARKWNVSAGVAMTAACLKWRIEYGVDRIIRQGEEGFLNQDGFLNQLKIGKAFVQGTDRQGRPVVYINVRLHKPSEQSFHILEEFIVFCMESVRLFLTPPLVEKATIIIDMSGFGLANMDWKSLAFIIKCLEAYYPESLNVLVVHNPPWVFQGLWKIIAPMLDPVVRAKIQISKSTEELKTHIDEKYLIESLGGTNKWKWEYEPVKKDENLMMKDSISRLHELKNRSKLIKTYLDLTRKWCEESSPIHLDSISTSDQLIDDDQLSDIAKLRKFVTYHLRIHYFVLDPYVRGRSIYHRKGRIIGNGLITFEYPQVTLPRLSSNDGTSPQEKTETIDLWDVLGYSMSRENLLILIEKMKADFKQKLIDLPVF